jgi:restriction system protein
VIAQTALRSLYEVFSADEASQLVDTVFYKGIVQGVDLGTGQRARPCVVNVLASPDVFRALELSRVDPVACLRTLHGELSKNPEELIPAELVLGFNVVDPRFNKREKA